jgi:hypothetical protein
LGFSGTRSIVVNGANLLDPDIIAAEAAEKVEVAF